MSVCEKPQARTQIESQMRPNAYEETVRRGREKGRGGSVLTADEAVGCKRRRGQPVHLRGFQTREKDGQQLLAVAISQDAGEKEERSEGEPVVRLRGYSSGLYGLGCDGLPSEDVRVRRDQPRLVGLRDVELFCDRRESHVDRRHRDIVEKLGDADRPENELGPELLERARVAPRRVG